MKCYFHEDKEAVGRCQDCGRYLCRECAAKYEPRILCDLCAEQRRKTHEERTKVGFEEVEKYCIKGLIVSGIALVFGLIFAVSLMVFAMSIERDFTVFLSGIISLCGIFSYPVLFSVWDRKSEPLATYGNLTVVHYYYKRSWDSKIAYTLLKLAVGFCGFCILLYVCFFLTPIAIIVNIQRIKIIKGQEIRWYKIFNIFS